MELLFEVVPSEVLLAEYQEALQQGDSRDEKQGHRELLEMVYPGSAQCMG